MSWESLLPFLWLFFFREKKTLTRRTTEIGEKVAQLPLSLWLLVSSKPRSFVRSLQKLSHHSVDSKEKATQGDANVIELKSRTQSVHTQHDTQDVILSQLLCVSLPLNHKEMKRPKRTTSTQRNNMPKQTHHHFNFLLFSHSLGSYLRVYSRNTCQRSEVTIIEWNHEKKKKIMSFSCFWLDSKKLHEIVKSFMLTMIKTSSSMRYFSVRYFRKTRWVESLKIETFSRSSCWLKRLRHSLHLQLINGT